MAWSWLLLLVLLVSVNCQGGETPNTSSADKPTVAKGLQVSDVECGWSQGVGFNKGKYVWTGLRGTVTNNGGTLQQVTARGFFLASDKVRIGSQDLDIGTLVPGKSFELNMSGWPTVGSTGGTAYDDVWYCDLELWINVRYISEAKPEQLRFSSDTPMPIAVENRDKPR